MLNKKQTRNHTKKYILAATLLLVILGAASFTWWKTHRSNSVENQNTLTQSKEVKVDLSPATEADKQDSNSHKNPDAVQQQPAPGTKLAVTPVIVDASQYGQQVEVRSHIAGVVENGGICKFTFSRGGTSFQRQNTAIADATTTRCPNLTLDSTEFAVKGTWSVTVSYDSPKASGASSSVNMEIK